MFELKCGHFVLFVSLFWEGRSDDDAEKRIKQQEDQKSHLVEIVNVSSMKLTWMEKTAGDKEQQRTHSWSLTIIFIIYIYILKDLFDKHTESRLTDEDDQQQAGGV